MLAPVVTRHGMYAASRALLTAMDSDCETGIKRYFSFGEVIFLNSGKQALVESINSLKKLSGRNKVIVQSYTCFSVAKAIYDSGLAVQIVDTDPETLDFHYDELEKVVDENTLCVIATHLFGVSANIARLRAITRRQGAFLIEDASQKQLSVDTESTLGDAAIYSFGRGKPLSLMGGGILGINGIDRYATVLGKKTELAGPAKLGVVTYLKMLANDIVTQPMVYGVPARIPVFGIGETIYPEHIETGDLSRFQKCFLLKMLARIAEDTQRRRQIAAEYRRYFQELDVQNKIAHTNNGNYAPHRYPFYIKSPFTRLSSSIKKHCKQFGIVQMYPRGINTLPQLKNKIPSNSPYYGADYIANHLVTAPTHVYVNHRHLESIKAIIKDLI